MFALIKDFIYLIITYLPGSSGIKLRRLYYKKKFLKCGKNLIVHPGVFIENPGSVEVGDFVTIDHYTSIRGGGKLSINLAGDTIGENRLIIGNKVHIGSFCIIAFHAGVIIGNNCVIGSGTKIYSMSNSITDTDPTDRSYSLMPYSNAKFYGGLIDIQNNCWITLDCIIMPAVKVGADCFVGSGTILTKPLEENTHINRSGKTTYRFKNNG